MTSVTGASSPAARRDRRGDGCLGRGEGRAMIIAAEKMNLRIDGSCPGLRRDAEDPNRGNGEAPGKFNRRTKNLVPFGTGQLLEQEKA